MIKTSNIDTSRRKVTDKFFRELNNILLSYMQLICGEK